VKVNWHADDVKDYSLRTYFPAQFAITQKKFATSAEATDAFASLNFVSGKNSLSSFGVSTNSLYKWTRGWWGQTGYFLQHAATSTTQACDYTIRLIANAASAKIYTDSNSVCTPTVTTGKTTFTCICKLGKASTNPAPCNYYMAMEVPPGTGYGVGFGLSYSCKAA